LLSNLVDKSLITVRQGQEARYHMLETIRQYARGKLLESTELVRIHRRHTRYFLQLAEEAESKLRAANQVIWHKRLEHEQDNFRAALSRSLKNEFVEMGARLAVALITYWDQRGQLSESSGWLERFLAVPNLDDLIRAKILIGAAHFAWQQSNHEQALDLIEQSLALCRRHSDKQGIARSLFLSGVIAHWLGDRDQGANFLEESLSLSREMEDDPHVIDALLFLGDVRLRQGKNELAETIWQEGLTRSRKSGDQWGLAFAQSALGELARRKGDLEHAVSYFQASLNIQVGPGFKVEIPFTLEALAMTVAELGHAKPAAQLWGAAEGLRQDIQAPLPHSYHGEYAPYKDVIKAALGEDVFAEVWADAQTMSLEQAVTLAMSVPVEEAQSPTASTQKSTFGLTPREVEVLRLVATGMTDAQVATELVISPRTVSKHLQSIYSKLALPSRSAATRYAIEHDLL
jgi:DNA-binding CsgD family transcriptional regulator/tetratricopeptide (TPR) repeat protein